jgi:hypothetical protein
MSEVTIYKHDHRGEYVFHYTGNVVERGETWVCIEAHFGHEVVNMGYVVFRRGDFMREWFYNDRWYNIFRVEDGNDQRLKGWYCNITRPAALEPNRITADDLALDVFVTPAGAIILDDENEFEALDLAEDERAAALAAVATLRDLVATRSAPFDEIQSQ